VTAARQGHGTESYLYSYFSSGPTPGFLQNVTLRRSVNGGAWSTVRQVTYSYYDGSLPGGNWGDLEQAVLADGPGNVLDTLFNRYYPAQLGDPIDLLKYAVGAASYGRLETALGGANPLGATDAQVSPYADEALAYDGHQRVTTATA
jgi:hypothetical protein